MKLPFCAWLGLGLACSACFPPGEGVEPPLERVYFPVGIGLSADNDRLFVVNSDFDLQFNSGSVQLIDLRRAHQLLPVIDGSGQVDCGELGPQDPFRSGNVPGPCRAIPLTRDGADPLILDAVGIGAFATDLALVHRPADAGEGPPSRLFIPVRGDNTLHWIDFDGDRGLECGQANNGGLCDDRHRNGDNAAAENTRQIELPPEPFGVATTQDGRVIVVTHQTEGSASLFTNDWSAAGPGLQFVTGGMPSRPIGVAAIPAPAAAEHDPSFSAYTPGFLVSFRNASEVRLLRFFDDQRSDPARPFLQSAGVVDVRANALNFDSRGLAVDDSRRAACERACNDDAACESGCATVPLDVYIANRTPASLLVGQTRVSDGGARVEDLPRFYDSIPLPFGPSRVVAGDIVNPAGERERRIFVLCFDARRIVVYDPARRREETWIVTGRGPHALVIDSQRGFGYVAHFTDSYIGMIDLDQRRPRSYGKLVASLGTPTAPRASK